MNQQKKRVKLAAGKAGRPKKLTPEQLRRGVEAYFASISYLEPVEIEEPVILETDPETGAITYQRDSYGHIMFRRRPVTDAAGKQLMRLKYIEPPGESSLCDYLKIYKSTWERYGKALEILQEKNDNPTEEELREAAEYADIHELAGGRVRAYLERAAEEKIASKGAIFKLDRIYGLGEKKEVTVSAGGGVEEFLRNIGGEAEY